jgi:hypothetical protein
MKQFLSWLARDEDSNSKKLLVIFRGEGAKYSEGERSKVLGTAIVQWYRFSYERLSKTARVQYKSQILKAFSNLNTENSANYPRVDLSNDAFRIKRSHPNENLYEIEHLEKFYSKAFIRDIERYSKNVYSMRHFLTWLARDTHKSSQDLVAVLSDRSIGEISPAQKVGLIATGIRGWKRDSANVLKTNTLGKYSHNIGVSFEALGRFDGSPYPEYDRRMVPSGERELGSSTTLGDLDWPEISHLRGAEKERAALALVREGTASHFQEFYKLFKFGQSALTDGCLLNHADGGSAKAVSVLLQAAQAQILELGTFNYASIAGNTNYSDPQVWLNAGAPPKFLSSRNGISPEGFILYCLGATKMTAQLAAYVLGCDTGINLQPCFDLDRYPFVYLDHETAGIADQGVIDSFKGRAGHSVAGYLTRSSPGTRDDLAALWENVCGEADGGREAVLAQHSTIELLEQFQEMADATRDYSPLNEACGKFFIYRSPSRLANLDRLENRWLAHTPFLSRKGVNWRAIRKSFAQVNNKDTGSRAATRAVMGHRSQAVLASAYLNSPDLIAELEQSTAFFQNVLQALLVRGQLVEIIIKIPTQHVNWYNGLAKISGIESAVGIGTERLDAGTVSICFEPTDERFAELYLLFLAAKLAKRTVSPARWRIQAMPLLGMIRALRRCLLTHGLRQAYVSAIRRVFHEIKSEHIVIPTLLEA